jgi:GNAT superfamily N-acetyltransferase
VQAASLPGDTLPDPGTLAAAEARMRDWGQAPLFRLVPGQDALDAALAARGYRHRDPTHLLTCPLAPLLEIEPPRLSCFDIWPPLAVMAEIWQAGGIGPDRIAVMARVAAPRTALLGRLGDRPSGTAYVAIAGTTAMVHALEVRDSARRAGLARRMMGHAARWADRQGATTMAVLVTEANAPALALYASLGMRRAGRYHYRKLEDAR